MKSILHKVSRADIVREPFPHVVVDGALEDDLYARLASSFPPAEVIVDGRAVESNAAYHLRTARLLGDPRVAECWKDFARYHTSSAFFREVLSLFGDAIRELHPSLRLAGARTSIRDAEPFADVALDCQPCWGAPVAQPSSCDRCHIDRPVALFAGLLYCRLADDDSAGGDLHLYRFRGEERRYDATRHVDAELVELVRHIGYAANRLVFFIQSPHSLHGVTVRSATPWPRLHVNFIGELQSALFEIEPSPVSATRSEAR
jgi:hypothetical protein